MGMVYVDVAARDRLIEALLQDKSITKVDLQIAFFLRNGGKTRKDIALEFFGGSEHSSKKAYGNRASVTRALKRLAPYLKKPENPNKKVVDKNHEFDNEYGEYIDSTREYVFTLKAGLPE